MSVLLGNRVTWCRHLMIVERSEAGGDTGWRACLVCGVRYDRCALLERLKADIRERHRLPPSPWSAAEHAVDTW